MGVFHKQTFEVCGEFSIAIFDERRLFVCSAVQPVPLSRRRYKQIFWVSDTCQAATLQNQLQLPVGPSFANRA